MKKYKTLYKARYVIDIEISSEPFSKENEDGIIEKISSVRQDTATRNFGEGNDKRDLAEAK